ncbi:unnamed protein product [Cylicostephanus goldi]|uniref:FERM domain-containing protein n=1 Tax=Cylicostephanus goldi TaxID=71465 RepID=A0A3P6QPE1_CYLGO|nr:unnamed protein product [Cylicostephanus goldi]
MIPGPAVVSPSIHNIRPGQTYVTVQTLTKENLVIVVNQKTKVHDVLWKCGEILEITEDKLFGLALRQPTEGIGGDQPRHEYFFLDPAQKIVKYAPKQPRFSNWILQFFLRIILFLLYLLIYTMTYLLIY